VLWLLLWTGLALGAGVLFFVIARSLWRKGMALLRELGSAADRLGAVLDRRDERQPTEPARLAVFTDVEEARQALAAGRAAGARGRKGRGAAQRPAHRAAPVHPVTPARRLERPGPPTAR
jgi:hypothetical protein